MANLANLKKFVKSLQVICTSDSTKVLKASICLKKTNLPEPETPPSSAGGVSIPEGPCSASYSFSALSRLYRRRQLTKKDRTCDSVLVPMTSAIVAKFLPNLRTPEIDRKNSLNHCGVLHSHFCLTEKKNLLI